MEKIIKKFSECKVLVIGDPILDTYLKGNTSRICREAPVPVFDVDTVESVCGGAANTAINVASLGAATWFATVTGNDQYADKIISILQQQHVNISSLIRDANRFTVVKQRLIAEMNILYRIDHGTTAAIFPEIENELIRRISIHWDSADVIIISDYGNGIITERIIDFLQDALLHLPKPVIADAKDLSRFAKLKPACVKPNYTEALGLLDLSPVNRSERASQMIENNDRLFELTGAECICVTLDKDGVIMLNKDRSYHRILCIPFDNKKAIGAGDTFTAALSVAFAKGSTLIEACNIAAHAAAVVVQKEGTAGCSQDELISHMKVQPKFVSDHNSLKLSAKKIREQGRKIVFTNGCFDILHKGHINFLEEARKLGDFLVLAVNNDASIRKIKGDDRPVNTLEDRISVLSALEPVDLIIAYEEETCEHLIETLRPDVFVKGSSYAHQSIPEAMLAKDLGIRMEIISTTSQHSTSGIINKIRRVETLIN